MLKFAMGNKYTLKALLKLVDDDGERVLTIADYQENFGDCSRRQAYRIINGEATIFTNEISRLARWIRERGIEDFTVDNIDCTGLRTVYHSYT